MKKVLIAFVPTVLIAASVYYYFRQPAKEGPAGPQLAPVKVERGSVVLSVTSTGKVVSNLDSEIKAKASGLIKELPRDISDEVKKDELLVRLDPIDEQRNVNRAKIELKASQAKLAQARQNLEIATLNLKTTEQKVKSNLTAAEARAKDSSAKAERMRQLLEKGLISQEEYDTAQTSAVQAEADRNAAEVAALELEAQKLALEVRRQDVTLAETQEESDKVSLDMAVQRLTETEVLAPISGRVSARTVQVGQIISSGITNVGGGTAILTISDLSHMFVLASVDESDIGKVQLEQPVKITADAYPEIKFDGKVVRVATKGVNVSNVVTFEVKIEVTSQNKSLLKPEMTTNVEVIAADRKDVLTVPADAVTRRGPKRLVTLMNGDKPGEEREVKVGISDGVVTEIVSGLEEGQMVGQRKGDAESRWKNDGGRAGGGRRGGPMGGPH